MSDDDSVKALLEKLCTLQELHLALLRESIQRREGFEEREQQLQQAWERQMALYEETQKAHDEREARHEKESRLRGVLTLILWFFILVALVVSWFR